MRRIRIPVKAAVVLVAVAIWIGLVWLARGHFTLAQLAAQEVRLRDAIFAHPWSSLAVGLFLYYTISLVPGTSGKAIVAGWLFGLWRGVLLVELGLTAAALTMFALSRYVLRDAVELRLEAFLGRLNEALHREGAFYLLAMRLLHVPYTLMNYGAGASRVGIWTFGWTTAVGLLPGTIVFVLVGTQLPTLYELVDNGVERVLDPRLAMALVALGVLPWLTRWLVRRVRR